MARRAGVVGGFTLLSRVAGFVRDAVMVNIFGAGVAYDAFVVAQTIPNMLRRLVAEGSLMIAFVPILGAQKRGGGLPAMRAFTSAVIGVLIPILIGLVLLGVLFPEVVLKLVASGFGPERAALAVQLTRLAMPFLLFISLTAVASGVLNVQGVFGPPAAAPILLNVLLVVGAIVGVKFFSVPIAAVAAAMTLGGLAQLLLQIPFLARTGMLVAPRWEPNHPAVRTLFERMGPAVFGVAVYQLNIVVIRNIASWQPTGQLSCYYAASRLEEFALGVFAVSISIAALPTLSDHAARGDRQAVIRTYRRAVRATNFITVPSAVGLFILAEPIVGVLYRHGNFSADNGALTAILLQIMAVALIPIGLVRVTVPTYFAFGNTRTPVTASIASLLATVIFGFTLQYRLQIIGLTLATLAGALAQVVVLGLRLRPSLRQALGAAEATKAELPNAELPDAELPNAELPDAEASPAPSEPDPSIIGHALRCVAAIAPPALLVGLIAQQRVWMEGRNLQGAAVLAGLIVVAAVGYAVIGRLIGIGEIDLLWNMIRGRLRRR